MQGAGVYQQQMRMHSPRDSEENVTGIVNGETSDRKIIDHEKDREIGVDESGEIQDCEIMFFERGRKAPFSYIEKRVWLCKVEMKIIWKEIPRNKSE